MEIKINLIDRIYDQIEEMCKFNNISIEEYVINCVEDNFNILKYGDLNDKFKKEEEKPKPIIEKKEIKKRGRPKKDVEIKIEKTEEVEDTNKEDIKKIEDVKKVSTNSTTPTKTKRILKTK